MTACTFYTTVNMYELEAPAEGRVVDDDPATVEAELLQEQDEIEFALGEDYLDRRDG